LFITEDFDDTIAEDTEYAVTNANRGALVSAINSALLFMGEYCEIDESTTFAFGSKEIALPADVYNVVRVEIANTEESTSRYFRVTNWRESDGKIQLAAPLYFHDECPVRIYYLKRHPRVFSDSDIILPQYNQQRLAWTAAYMFLLDRMQYSGNADEKENYLLQNAQQVSAQLSRQFPVNQIWRDPILAV
jgi:hypothetical protein